MFRFREGHLEMVLCGRTDLDLWGLPKGTPQAGESIEDTAIREVTEETGLQVRIVAPIGTISYWFVRTRERVRYHKLVHHYLMVPVGGDLSFHDHEYDQVAWFCFQDALRNLTYPNEAAIVRKAAEMAAALAG
ncbi:MAG TPA: NUDIX domain-containing protein [Dehalococcoidia bacterium]|nr:NUDIX domain-containing protein [Dehalococcoidia bacterium]